MKLNITKDTSTREIKKQFEEVFPNLKLQFMCEEPSLAELAVAGRNLRPSHQRDQPCCQVREGVFTFTPALTVAEFRKRMKKEFGLGIRLFRSEGNLRIEIDGNSQLSLVRQNAIARAASKPPRFNINSLFL
ncbi:hypothetical protein [Flavisolibacter nicotianae]|uniref:hypothetical protein n=1 Tax=Flavisolibacter nicotianae TaxID=2364882 RepID=UPI000EB4BE35|nr:hypothetical protein [Flavisolibacter nicotianae]